MRFNRIVMTILGVLGISFAAVKTLSTGLDELSSSSIIGSTDDRVSFADPNAGQLLGLSHSEMESIKRATGYVVCVDKEGGRTYGSAAIVHSARTVVTASHVLKDFSDLSGCHFQNQMESAVARRFDSSMDASQIVRNSELNDYAVLRLVEDIPDAIPFRLVQGPVREGTELMMISANQSRPESPFDMQYPVGQVCRVRDVWPANEERGTIFYSDCDLSHGGSGSLNLIRQSVGGFLGAFAIAVGAGSDSHADGREYDKNENVYTVSILISDGLREAILKVSGDTLLSRLYFRLDSAPKVL